MMFNSIKKSDMEKRKMIFGLAGVCLFLFSSGKIPDNSLRTGGSDFDLSAAAAVQQAAKSTQTVTKSAQTKTKTQPGAKSVQTKTKSSKTVSKSTPTNSKTSKTEAAPRASYPGTVKIGTQLWAVANLDVSTFRNGDSIPQAKSNKEWVAAGASGKPAWCYYNNDPAIGKVYGKLYNWYAVNDPRGLAPTGWKLPSDADWATMINSLGGQGSAGNKLKSSSKWNEGSNGSNESGFNGYPEGYRVENGLFSNIGSIGIWWTSTENNKLSAFDHYLSQTNNINNSNSPKERGESVRCIRE
jgi:uncharacterized protein (TIGR02145 family)